LYRAAILRMKKLSPLFLSRPAFWAVLASIAFSLVLIGYESWARYAVINLTLEASLGQPLPAFDKNSPTGFEGGMRRVILPSVGADGYQWIMHTQKLLHDGGWRIRFTDQDNAPVGREIHWSHSFIWWLIGVGAVHSLMTGWPLPASVEAVSPYANTLILLLIVLTMPWVVWRKFGVVAACVFACSLSVIYLFYEIFIVGYPDHHGIAAASAMACSLFLAFAGGGWVKTPGKASPEGRVDYLAPEASARWWFIASAVSGGVSLWISAATAVPVFAGIGVAAGLCLFVMGPNDVRAVETCKPALWRVWGIAGACSSLFFYFLEYFPSHMGMRLEVNHPLYALAWLCGGELLCRFAQWRATGKAGGAQAFGVVVLCVIGLLALPTLIKLAPDRFFAVSDSFLWQLHRDHINEFKSIFRRVNDTSLEALIVILSIVPLVTVFMLRFLWLKEIGKSWKAMLAITLAPALVLTILGLFQVRWLAIADALWIAALPTWVACAVAVGSVRRFPLWQRAVVAIFFLLLLIQYPQNVVSSALDRIGKKPGIGPNEAYMMVVRDLAFFMRREAGDKEIVLLSGPTTTTWMMFFGGMKGIGTLYWENTEGLKSAAQLYAARSADEALELARKNRVTHIAIFSLDAFSSQYIRLIRGLPPGSEPTDAFAQSLLYSLAMPQWLTPMQYALPAQLKNEWIALAEVHPDQTPAEARLGFGRFYASRGNLRGARSEYEQAVALDPKLKDAHVELAGFMFLSGETMAARIHLGQGLEGRSNDEIAGACFAIAGHCQDAGRHAAAVEVLRRGIEAAPDAPSLRNLLAWILATSRDDDVRQPEEALILAATNVGFLGNPVFLNTLAAAQAATGSFVDAMDSAQRALDEARKSGEPEPVIRNFETRLKLYQSRQPMRE